MVPTAYDLFAFSFFVIFYIQAFNSFLFLVIPPFSATYFVNGSLLRSKLNANINCVPCEKCSQNANETKTNFRRVLLVFSVQSSGGAFTKTHCSRNQYHSCGSCSYFRSFYIPVGVFDLPESTHVSNFEHSW
uniref:Uncharacterized protein n=1 Tax=Proboscia inermis TaxID=420281 RepID=A0A6T8HNK3_9STRA